MLADLRMSHVVAGIVAVLVGYTGSVAIIFQAIEAAGASQAQANSWMLALGVGCGVSSLYLSLRHRMPVLTAWSTPGAALLAVALPGVPLSEAVGAFVFCGVLLWLTGVTGWFEKLAKIIPDAIANAMLAGVLFQFGLGVFTALPDAPVLVGAMCGAFLAGRLLMPRMAIPLVLLVGIGVAVASGQFQGGVGALEIARPVFVMPEWSLSVMIGVGVPLYLVTMSSQNMAGVVVLKASGYAPPVSSALSVTGLLSLALAPFGGFAINLAAITAAICAGPEAGEEKATRYWAAAVSGVVYLLLGLFGAAVVSLFLVAPKALVVTVAGLALLATIGNALNGALERPSAREAALVAFLVTVSGISFAGIASPVWGLLFGVTVLYVLSPEDRPWT